MSAAETSETEDFPTENDCREEKQDGSKKDDSTKIAQKNSLLTDGSKKDDSTKIAEKNSLLTDMMKVDHHRSLYNLCLVACIHLFVFQAILYLAEPSKLWEDLETMRWAAEKVYLAILVWMVYFLYALVAFEFFKIWTNVRNTFHAKVIDCIFLFLYIGGTVLIIGLSGYFMLTEKLRPIWGMVIGPEKGRICMKVYAFVRENVPRVMNDTPQKGEKLKHSLCPTRKQFLYYFFAPTFMYKDSYPRSEKTNWKNFFKCSGEFCLCLLVGYCVLFRGNDLYKNAGKQAFTKKEALVALAVPVVMGTTATFLLFYTSLHCWQNIFAELLRFGNKEFYLDWWNSTTAGQYYRKWNLPVHEWLHKYCYLEFQRFGCNQFVSRSLTFLISSLYHDYILTLCLGFFYPVFTILYSFGGIVLVSMTRGKKHPLWNCGLWFYKIFILELMYFCYTLEWYARVNCPKEETVLNFFIIRSWDPSCPTVNFLQLFEGIFI